MILRYSLPGLFPKIGELRSVYLLPLAGVEEGTDDVNPREYLNDIISRMPYMEKASYEQLVELLPHKWKLIPHEPAVTLPTNGKPFVTKVYR